MGMIYTDLELMNAMDIAMAKKNLIGEDEIKRTPVNCMVDTGAYTLAINEYLLELLDLPIVERKQVYFANGKSDVYPISGPVEVRYKGRRCCLNAVVLPGDSQPLLGTIPMEEMNLVIDPVRHELELKAYGELPHNGLYSIRQRR